MDNNQLQYALQQLQSQANAANARARDAMAAVNSLDARAAQHEQQIARMAADSRNLADVLARVKGSGGSAMTPEHIKYVEQIPGRRIPFDMLVAIPIGANITSDIQRTVPVSQDGPFIAVRRFATFLSGMQFSYINPSTGAQAAFQGRSYGRFRPIHSAWDINDASASIINPTTGGPLPGAGQSIFASASNVSGFRTMQFDGYVKFENQGTAYPRQVIPVPTSFYTEQINSPFDLAALDFFEKSEVLSWTVSPTHPNNPSYGNVSGIGTGGSFPFIASQYDVHEGINDPELNNVTNDPITRLPSGTLIIGFHGYRIYQPPGVVGSR
jgi:hypothetical protein